jgi:hypothetical protein
VPRGCHKPEFGRCTPVSATLPTDWGGPPRTRGTLSHPTAARSGLAQFSAVSITNTCGKGSRRKGKEELSGHSALISSPQFLVAVRVRLPVHFACNQTHLSGWFISQVRLQSWTELLRSTGSPQCFRSNFNPFREVGRTACFRVSDTRCGTYYTPVVFLLLRCIPARRLKPLPGPSHLNIP